MTDSRTPQAHERANEPSREPGSQPDPMLESGNRGSVWIWLAALFVLVIVVTTLYGLNNQETQTASKEPAPAQVTGSNAGPQSQPSGNETTGAAPKDQQNNGQSGQDKGTQKSGNGQQGGSANSQNNAAPRAQQGGQTNQQPPKQQ